MTVRKLYGHCVGDLVVHDRQVDENGCRRRDIFRKIGANGRYALESKKGVGGWRWKWKFTPGHNNALRRLVVLSAPDKLTTTNNKGQDREIYY